MAKIVDEAALVLDACCLINLAVTGKLQDLVSSLGVRVIVPRLVWIEEIPSLRDTAESDLDTLVSDALIELADFEDKEADAFVEFAAELGDDGEAATFAIALRRKLAVATDDRAAIRFVQRKSPETVIVSSPELLRHWASSQNPSSAEVRDVLTRVRDVGRYVPGPNHPLAEWWRKASR